MRLTSFILGGGREEGRGKYFFQWLKRASRRVLGKREKGGERGANTSLIFVQGGGEEKKQRRSIKNRKDLQKRKKRGEKRGKLLSLFILIAEEKREKRRDSAIQGYLPLGGEKGKERE